MTDIPMAPRKLKPCQTCGKVIPRRLGSKKKGKGRTYESWPSYNKRKYCSRKCVGAALRKSHEQVAAEDVKKHVRTQLSDADQVIAEKLGADWIEWAYHIQQERGFDPLGFYRLAWMGEFEVDFQTSSGEGLLGIQKFFPRGSQDYWYRLILTWRRLATDEAFRAQYVRDHPEYEDRRFGRFNRLVVKSRRFGMTTGMAIGCLGDGTANRGFGTIVTAYSDDGLRLLSEIFRTALKRDKEAGAKGMATKRYETSNDSVVQLLGPRDSLGRGGGFFHILVSEADYIPDLDSMLDSVLPSIGKSPFSMVVVESTMRKGSTTGYKDFVRRSMRGETDYEVVFLGWMQDDTAVLEPTEKERKYIENIKAMNAVSDVDQYILKLKRMGATLQQITWWYQRLKEDARGLLDRMIEAYPTTLEEALEHAEGDEWLTGEGVEFLRQQVRPPIARYTMDCEAKIPMQKLSEGSDWENTPHMRLWFPPQSGEQYAVIMDSGTGKPHGGENVALVLDVNQGKVCAAWSSRRSIYEFAQAGVQVARYYNNALIVPENNKDGGLIEHLNIRLKYPLSRLYFMEEVWKDFIEDKNTIGYTMTRWSRAAAMDRLQMVVNEKRLINPCKELFDQVLLTGERKGIAPTAREKMAKPDDYAMCLAIASIIRNYSSKWPSRTRDEMLALLSKPQEVVDYDLRESVNSYTPEYYAKLAKAQRRSAALARSRGG